MDVVKVTRGHQATVPSRGEAKPATSPTFNLLGHRRAKDGMTWHEHYKRAAEHLAKIHQDPGLRPILEEISADPRYQQTGHTQQQLINYWTTNPQAAAAAIADYSRRNNIPAGLQIAESVANPELPGNTYTQRPSAWDAPVNTAAAALIPWQPAGLLRNAIRFAPDAGIAWLASAPPEMRTEAVHRLGDLYALQSQRSKLPAGSAEAQVVDQQIAQAQAALKPITGVAETSADDVRQLLSAVSNQGFQTTLSRALGPTLPAISATGMLSADPNKRREALGKTVGQVMGGIVARDVGQFAADGTRLPFSKSVQEVYNAGKNLPEVAGQKIMGGGRAIGRGLQSLKSLVTRTPAAAPSVATATAEGGEALQGAGRLAQMGRTAGAFGRGLGQIARVAPAVGTALTGGREAINLYHNAYTPEGQDELAQKMIARDAERENGQSPGRIIGGATADALKAMLLGDTDPAKADLALGLANEAKGEVPQEVLDARQNRADYRWQTAAREAYNKGFQQMLPQLPGTANDALASGAVARQWAAEHGEPIDPQQDEQQMEEWVNEARQRGYLNRDVTPAEMDRFKAIARVAGPDATLDTFFPKTYDWKGQPTGERAAHPSYVDHLAENAAAPPPVPEELQYFHRGAYAPAVRAAPVPAAAKLLALPPVAAHMTIAPKPSGPTAQEFAANLAREHVQAAQQQAQHTARMSELDAQQLQSTRADTDQFVKSVQEQAAAPAKPLALPPVPGAPSV